MCGGQKYINCEHIPKGAYNPQKYKAHRIPTTRVSCTVGGFTWPNGKFEPEKKIMVEVCIRLCPECNQSFEEALGDETGG